MTVLKIACDMAAVALGATTKFKTHISIATILTILRGLVALLAKK